MENLVPMYRIYDYLSLTYWPSVVSGDYFEEFFHEARDFPDP